VRKYPEDRVRALGLFVSQGRAPGSRSHGRSRWLSEDLMRRIWPEGRWSASEARSVVGAFEQEQVLAEPVHGWIVQAVMAPPGEADYLASYQELCQVLEARYIDKSLPKEAQRRLDSFLTTRRMIERVQLMQGKAKVSIIQRLATSYAGLAPPAQDLLRAALAGQVEELAGSRHLPKAVEAYPASVVSAFLDLARRRLAAAPPDVAGAARLLHCLASLRSGRDVVIAPGLDETLREELRLWRRADLNRVHGRLQQADPEVADWFTEWRQERLTTGLRRSWRRLLTRHAEGAP
jgi:hypothetical protein